MPTYKSARDKFLGLSLESTRKSYYPQLKEQLEATKENARRLQILMDNVPARISYVDSTERYVMVNKGYEQAFGLSRDKIVGRPVESVLGPENYNKIKKHIHGALAGNLVHYETTFTGLQGQIDWLDVTYVPDFDKQGNVNGFYVLTLIVTEKKRAEEERAKLEATLQQVQKREAIGTLAGGIAHDFNNLLMGIQGRASLMSVDLDPDHPHMEHLRAIEEYIRSAMNLTKQLLGFARGGKYEVKPLDINELVLKSSAMFGRTQKDIQIHTKLDQSLLVVEADQRQIEQVLLNMYVNAWQAMPDGGNLFLETGIVTLDRAFCEPHEIEPGRYVKVSVTDTGIGMDSSTSQRVFDPFFTTKEMSRGTGLGLASAYGIVNNHGGVITVHSEVGHGTIFNIYLPLSDKEVHREAPLDATLIKGSEKILLVDDEEMVIDVGRALLEKLGYQVVVANGGEAAVDTISKMGKEIDLVVLDMIMPEMDGGRAFDLIREIRPDVPVILSSGYSIDGKANEIMQRGCNGFIQKPFNISELSKKVRSILDDAKRELSL